MMRERLKCGNGWGPAAALILGLSVAALVPVDTRAADEESVEYCIEQCEDARDQCVTTVQTKNGKRQEQCDSSLSRKLGWCNTPAKLKGWNMTARECKRTVVQVWTWCRDDGFPNDDYDTDDHCYGTEKRCIRDCQPSTGGGSGGEEAGYRVEPCPPGTNPSPVGGCMAVFRGKEGTSPDEDDCTPGPDDNCVPQIAVVVKKLPGTADGYLIACPDGMKPSPIDGHCIVDDTGPTSGEGEPGRCPPGTVRGPDDGPCLPRVTGGLDMYDALMLEIVGSRRTVSQDLLKNLTKADSSIGVSRDISATLEATARSLGMELVEEGNLR